MANSDERLLSAPLLFLTQVREKPDFWCVEEQFPGRYLEEQSLMWAVIWSACTADLELTKLICDVIMWNS